MPRKKKFGKCYGTTLPIGNGLRFFSEGSKAVSDWKEGNKIHFLNENNDGMYST